MMTTKKVLLEFRCWQRCYTLKEVAACIISQDGDDIVIDVDSPAYPRHPKPGCTPDEATFPAGLRAPPPEPDPDLTRTDAPSFLTKVKNFATAAAKHIAAGAPLASDEEIIRRHDICMACEFMKDGACTQCGCPIVRARQYVSKLSWADSECPVGKWGKVK